MRATPFRSRTGRASRAVTAAALLAVTAAGLAGCSGDDGSGTSASPTAVPSDAPAGPPPPSATTTPSVGISTAPAVDIGKAADIKEAAGAKVTVKVDRVQPVETEPVPGEVPGPGLAVTLSVTNSTTEPFSLTGLVVTASYGADKVPGEVSSGAPAAEMTGELAPGQSSKGVYVFRIPDGEKRGGLQLQVSSDESPTVVEFTG